MRYYFTLQFRRLRRHIHALGIQPDLGLGMAIIAILAFCQVVYYRTEFAPWVIIAIASYFAFATGTDKHRHILQLNFGKSGYFRIRTLETLIITTPFVLMLLIHGDWTYGLALLAGGPVLVTIASIRIRALQVPTPFRSFPFEFPRGFRQTWPLFGILIFLVFKSIQIGNQNLGLFALGSSFFIAMSYYFKPEPLFFAWIYSFKPRPFLIHKLRSSIICSTILTSWVFVALIIAFPESVRWIIIIQALGYLFLITTILAKYSAYPAEMSIPQGVLFALGLWFPPLLLVTIPIFYRQAIRRLETVLV